MTHAHQVMSGVQRRKQNVETALVTIGFLFCFLVIPWFAWRRFLIWEGLLVPGPHTEL
jgi:hypothetical protein